MHPDIPVTVSAPLPHIWRDAILATIANSKLVESVLVITVSAQFSASFDAARVGAEMARESARDVRVEVFDSDSAAGAQALVCLAATDTADTGADIGAVSAAALAARERVRTVSVLGSLDQIHRVGRVPAAALWAARAVGLKPVVSLDATGWRIVARPLSRRWGIRTVVAAVREGLVASEIDEPRAVVMHVQCERDAMRVASDIVDAGAKVSVCEMHPFAGVPAGTGTVGVAWVGGASAKG